MMTASEPQAGDPVILRGTIKALNEGVAFVEVYRTYPVGLLVPVQCGALELDELAGTYDAGTPA